MATISSNGTGGGLSNVGSTWAGGIVPVEGNKVNVLVTDTVTLNDTHVWGDDSVVATLGSAAINVYGTLKASRTISCSLTGKGLIWIDSTGAGVFDFGKEGDEIPQGVIATLILNKYTSAAFRDGIRNNTLMAGAVKSRVIKILADVISTTNTCELSFTPTNWNAGDEVLFVSTTNMVDNQEEVKVIDSVVGTIVTFTTPFSYNHKAGSPASNLSSNVVIKPYSAGIYGSRFYSGTHIHRDVRFDGMGYVTNRGQFINSVGVFNNCVYYGGGNVHFDNGLYYSKKLDSCVLYLCDYGGWGGSFISAQDCVFSCALYQTSFGSIVTDSWFSGVGTGSHNGTCTYIRCTFSGEYQYINNLSQIKAEFIECDLGYTYGYKNQYGSDYFCRQPTSGYATFKNCKINPYLLTPEDASDLYDEQEVKIEYIYINNNPLDNVTWTGYGKYLTSLTSKRSNTSIALTGYALTTTYGVSMDVTREIPCPNGESITIVGYINSDATFYNAGDWTAPQIIISGLGIIPAVHTATLASSGAWEFYSVTATNNVAGYDGSFTLTFRATRKGAANTGFVYFDGVPISHYVTRCRHYGYLIDEANPVRKVNPYIVASEATAIAYTGATVNGITKEISFSTGTADTAQKFYDYQMAYCCANLDVEIPFTRAGSLFSLTDSWTVIEPTYVACTWGGGTIQWDVPGAKAGSYDSNTFDFTVAGTYDFGSAIFGGTISLVNTSGGAVTVDLPAGVDYVNVGPLITVNVAVEQANGSIHGIATGSRLLVYNVTTATVIHNDIIAGTSYSIDYTDGTDFTAGDIVKVVLALIDGVNNKLPVPYYTIATSAGWSILAAQEVAEVYNTNGIDGFLVDEFTADYPNVQIDINDPDGVTTPQRGYAWYMALQMTADGIMYYNGAMTAEDEVNYRINVNVVDMYIQNVNINPLKIVGARLYRSDGSGVTVAGLGNIQMEYGRAYPVETGVSGLTPTESDKLLTLPSAETVKATFASGDPIPVNISKVSGTSITGTGVTGDSWRPL